VQLQDKILVYEEKLLTYFITTTYPYYYKASFCWVGLEQGCEFRNFWRKISGNLFKSFQIFLQICY